MHSNMRRIHSNIARHNAANCGRNNLNANPSVKENIAMNAISNIRVTEITLRAAALFVFASLFALSHQAGRTQAVSNNSDSAPAMGSQVKQAPSNSGTSSSGGAQSTPLDSTKKALPSGTGPCPASIVVEGWLDPQHSPKGPFYQTEPFLTMMQVKVHNTSGSPVSGLQLTASLGNIDARTFQPYTYSWPFSLAANESRYIPIYIGDWMMNSTYGWTLTGYVSINGKGMLGPLTFLNVWPPAPSIGGKASGS